MVILLVKMALYIVVSVLFGFLIGFLFSKAKNREEYAQKEQKYRKIINDKNSMLMKLKNELRSTLRKVDAINQGYDLQSKLLKTKESELELNQNTILDNNQIDKELSALKAEHRMLSMELSQKVKIIDDKDEIITLLEKKINQISKEKA